MKTIKELNTLEEINTRKIIDFLKEHKNEAYTREELRDIIGDFVPHSWRSGNWEIHWGGDYYWVSQDYFNVVFITLVLIAIFVLVFVAHRL